MRLTIATMVVATGLLAAAAGPAREAWAQAGPGARQSTAQAAFAQTTKRRARARTRIIVTPRYPVLRRATIYPTPFEIHAPGPGFVRQCTSWLAQEFRPSGTVLVPRMRCWWERG